MPDPARPIRPTRSVLVFVPVFVLMLAVSASAQPLSAVAERNYNRALRAGQAGNPDRAAEYWAESARGFAAWLDQRQGQRVFTDQLVMAGIALYKDGRMEAAERILERARKQDGYRFEPYVFLGLVHAAQGRADAALAAWKEAPTVSVPKKLAPVLFAQRSALARGETTAARAAAAVEDKCRELADEILVTDKTEDPWTGNQGEPLRWGHTPGGMW